MTEQTTVALKPSTKDRFDQAKPYESITADEFVNELLDLHEGER